jgi:hypothetical protein
MLLKVLNGCSITGHYWVFYAATTNLEFELTVTDTQENVTRRYSNILSQDARPELDTFAFDTCP